MKNDDARPEPAELLDGVTDTVIAAGALLRAEFHRPGGPKGGGSKANVDTEVEEYLRRRLLALHPCGWHGEETPDEAAEGRDVWVVDPQDGTRAFLKLLRGSAVSVALMRDRQPVLGVVYAPMAPDDCGDLFTWAIGRDLQRNGLLLGPPCSGDGLAYGAGTVIAFNEEAGDFAAANHARYAPAGVLAIPSIAYRLALAAAGEVDAAVSLTSGLDPYDVAGGHALLIGAGGVLLQRSGATVSYPDGAWFDGCVGGRKEVVCEVIRRGFAIGNRVPRHPSRPSRRSASTLQVSRAQGVMLGQLAGDALGSYVEFRSEAEIRRGHPEGVIDLRPGGHWGTMAGQPTDDSEMALALARCLADEDNFDGASIGHAYVTWSRSGPFDMGGTTANGIAALEGHGRPVAHSQSNGALMRVSPLGIYCAGDPGRAARLARQDAALTHPNPVCLAASSAFAAAIAVGVAGADHRTMWAVGHAHVANDDPGSAAVRAVLERALEAGPAEFQHNQGWVLIALGNAFRRLVEGQDLEHAVIETVASGGDTDTNAAICGALLGAAQGREAVPLRWRRLVLSCRAVSGSDVRHPRPTMYWPDDALDLAEMLLVAGGHQVDETHS